VQTLAGTTIAIEAKASDFIETMEASIQKRVGITAGHQRLIFAGKLLEMGHTLAGYNIHNGSTLQLAGRLRGGMPAADAWAVDVESVPVMVVSKDRHQNMFSSAAVLDELLPRNDKYVIVPKNQVSAYTKLFREHVRANWSVVAEPRPGPSFYFVLTSCVGSRGGGRNPRC